MHVLFRILYINESKEGKPMSTTNKDQNVDRIEIDKDMEQRLEELWKDAVFMKRLQRSAKRRGNTDDRKHSGSK